MKRKAIIISISGTKLSLKERNLIRKYKPWGIILFKRNLLKLNQIKKLTNDIRDSIKDRNYPILIDEEGGSVSRLSNILDNSQFSQKFFGKMLEKNPTIALKIFKNFNLKIINTLKQIGININTVPVLDILYPKTSKILKTSCYSKKINIIKKLGSECLKIYKRNKILTVTKHIPGHGRAKVDSHLFLPVVNNSLYQLKKTDFKSFKNQKFNLAMSAHILFKKIDKNNCVTHSNKIIKKIIRGYIGFKGILISDDISMNALKGNLIENATKSISAGCNISLYCAGKYNESKKLLIKMPYIDQFTQKKTSEIYKFLG